MILGFMRDNNLDLATILLAGIFFYSLSKGRYEGVRRHVYTEKQLFSLGVQDERIRVLQSGIVITMHHLLPPPAGCLFFPYTTM